MRPRSRADPGLAAAHFNRGSIARGAQRHQAARGSAYERATALDPNYVEPLAGLAWLDAQAGDAASARVSAAHARADAVARQTSWRDWRLASADLQQRDLAAAAARLSATLQQDPALTPLNRSIVLGLIGDLLDARGSAGRGVRCSTRRPTRELKALNAAHFEAPGQESALEQVRRLAAWFETADPQLWREASPARPRAADPKAHVFLVGFPRSGTTLLENVLAAHPEVVSLEEKDCLAPDRCKPIWPRTRAWSGWRGSAPAKRCASATLIGRWSAATGSSRAGESSSTRCRSPACSFRWSPSCSRTPACCSPAATRATWS